MFTDIAFASFHRCTLQPMQISFDVITKARSDQSVVHLEM